MKAVEIVFTAVFCAGYSVICRGCYLRNRKTN